MANVAGYLKLILGLTQSSAMAYSDTEQQFSQIRYDVLNGTTAGKMDLLYSVTKTADATEDFDLAGALTDPLGQTCVFADVRMICVVASSANTTNVVVGGAASNTFINWVSDATDKIVVKPGGVLFLYAPTDPGYAVTADTGDILTIAASSSTVTYDLYIGGTSA